MTKSLTVFFHLEEFKIIFLFLNCVYKMAKRVIF